MNSIIKAIFGASLQEADYTYPMGTPNYIRYGYSASKLIWGDKSCLLVMPVSDEWTLPSLKKQLKAIEKLCQMPLIVDIKRLSALQRTNLIESGIAFVSGTGQLFVPFWGSYFEEKIKNSTAPPDKMPAAAQLVFLYLYYLNRKNEEHTNLTQISEKLNIPKSTCTRTIQILESLNLISLTRKGTAKWIVLSREPSSILREALSYMTSPIQRRIYTSKHLCNIPYKISGIKALAERTQLVKKETDGGYAVSRSVAKEISNEILIDKQEFLDFGGSIIEVWKYDPALLSESPYVDDVSLMVSLRDTMDERIQNELDKLRSKYGIDGDEA